MKVFQDREWWFYDIVKKVRYLSKMVSCQVLLFFRQPSFILLIFEPLHWPNSKLELANKMMTILLFVVVLMPGLYR